MTEPHWALAGHRQSKGTNMIQRILFATDFSEGAGGAQRLAVSWTKQWRARLDILHVLELPPAISLENPPHRMYVDALRQQADRRLGELREHLVQDGIHPNVRVEVGLPSRAIEEIARELNADLLVLGTHGRTGLDHLLIGSTAERVVRTAPCPVLTVRTPKQGEVEAGLPAASLSVDRDILVPVDFSDCSLDALEYAVQIAKTFGAGLTVLHVLEPVFFGLDFTLRQIEERQQMRERAQSWLAEVERGLSSQGLRTAHKLIGGTPKDAILSFAREQASGLGMIIMGTHGRRGLSHLVCGSVAEWIVRYASCPVLAVKSPTDPPSGRRSVVRTSRPRKVTPWYGRLTAQWAGGSRP